MEEILGPLPCLGLFLVTGGVGGEVVARTAIEVVHACLETDSEDNGCVDEMTAPRCRDEVRLMMSPRRASCSCAESDCPEPGARRAGRHGAEVRFAGVLLAPGAAYIAHVGEMRVYRCRSGKLEERTRDDAVLDGGGAAGTI
ncbi:hypothetical protein [Sorangium sp. So ce1024]|uniref:hypothetical protein n=1 Tax=Sorangium sp. So ce1024 TaxID=3133327 RepID=UPI003F0B6191